MSLDNSQKVGGAYVEIGATIEPLKQKLAEAKQLMASEEKNLAVGGNRAMGGGGFSPGGVNNGSLVSQVTRGAVNAVASPSNGSILSGPSGIGSFFAQRGQIGGPSVAISGIPSAGPNPVNSGVATDLFAGARAQLAGLEASQAANRAAQGSALMGVVGRIAAAGAIAQVAGSGLAGVNSAMVASRGPGGAGEVARSAAQYAVQRVDWFTGNSGQQLINLQHNLTRNGLQDPGTSIGDAIAGRLGRMTYADEVRFERDAASQERLLPARLLAASKANRTAQAIIDAEKASHGYEAAARVEADINERGFGPAETVAVRDARIINQRAILGGRIADENIRMRGAMAIEGGQLDMLVGMRTESVNRGLQAISHLGVIGASASAVAVSRLMIGGQRGRAQEEEINQAYAGRLDDVNGRYAKRIADAEEYYPGAAKARGLLSDRDSETSALTAERDAKLAEAAAERKRNAENSVTQSNASAKAAQLRTNKQFYAADLAEFDRAAKARMDSMFYSTPGEKAAAKVEISAQRAELVGSQSTQRLISKSGPTPVLPWLVLPAVVMECLLAS